ncbi:hypothetical protein WJX74_005978 [Apatococcus lobatus]|uniref:Uncharacterized protein n=1 Tax=Apatococcus lobatus TaxID=904363 RepID=A0AAW1QDQ9_9CHLO
MALTLPPSPCGSLGPDVLGQKEQELAVLRQHALHHLQQQVQLKELDNASLQDKANHLEQQLTAIRDAVAAKDAQLSRATASIAAMQHAGDAKDKLLLDMRDAIEEAEQGLQQEAEERRAVECQAQVRLAQQQDEATHTRLQLEGALADAQAAFDAQQNLVQETRQKAAEEQAAVRSDFDQRLQQEQAKLRMELDTAKSEAAAAQQKAEGWHVQAQAAADAERRAAHAIQAAAKRLQALEAHAAQQQQQLGVKQHEVARLQSQLQEAVNVQRQALAGAEAEHAKQVSEMLQSTEALRAALADQKADFEAQAQAAATAAASEAAQHQVRLAAAQGRAQGLQQEAEAARAGLVAGQKAWQDSLRAASQEQAAAAAGFENHLRQQRTELQAAIEEAAAQRSAAGRLSQQLQACEMERDSLLAKIQEDSKTASGHEELKELTSQLADAKQNLHALQESQTSWEKERDQMRSVISAMRSDMELACQDMQKPQSQPELESLRIELAAAQEEAAELSSENQQLMAMSNKLRSERDRGAILLAALPSPSEAQHGSQSNSAGLHRQNSLPAPHHPWYSAHLQQAQPSNRPLTAPPQCPPPAQLHDPSQAIPYHPSRMLPPDPYQRHNDSPVSAKPAQQQADPQSHRKAKAATNFTAQQSAESGSGSELPEGQQPAVARKNADSLAHRAEETGQPHMTSGSASEDMAKQLQRIESLAERISQAQAVAPSRPGANHKLGRSSHEGIAVEGASLPASDTKPSNAVQTSQASRFRNLQRRQAPRPRIRNYNLPDSE